MVHLAEASDADQQAIEDIRKQWINERNPQLKLLLKMRLDVLVKEVNSAKTFEEEMKKATNRLYRAIAEMVQQGQGQMLVSMSPDELKSFLISSGMGDALTYFERSQVDIVELINKATIEIDPQFKSAPPNLIQAIAQQTSSQVFDAQILPSLSSAIRNMATTAIIVGSSKPVLDQMRVAFDKSVGVGTTQARTKIAEFGRSINALNADEAGLENFIYVGPKDGITRPFCRKLVGKVANALTICTRCSLCINIRRSHEVACFFDQESTCWTNCFDINIFNNLIGDQLSIARNCFNGKVAKDFVDWMNIAIR